MNMHEVLMNNYFRDRTHLKVEKNRDLSKQQFQKLSGHALPQALHHQNTFCLCSILTFQTSVLITCFRISVLMLSSLLINYLLFVG